LLLTLAACGREPAKVETAAAPTSLKEQADALDVSGLAQLALVQVRTGPGGPRPCQMVNASYDMGVIPADVVAENPLAQHAGARGFAVQCAEPGMTHTKEEFQSGVGQWLVLLPADSMTAVVLPCVTEPRGPNICWSLPPRQGATTTPISAPTPASP
jgi:hypothetical protein